MAHLLLLGSREHLSDIVRCLTADGHRVTLEERELASEDRGFDVLLTLAELPRAVPANALAGGQRFGAVDVQLPAPSHTMVAPRPSELADPSYSRRRPQVYRSGEGIHLQPGWFGEIVEGCVVLSVLHDDGAEVIIDFLGPGDCILPHPPDSCHVLPSAMTDVKVELSAWTDSVDKKAYAAALSARVLRAEAWAAARAHPYIEQRVLGILGLLVEQFGRPYEGGHLLGLRVTHSQLAAIAGVTRPTITRVLALLKKKGLVKTVGSGSKQMLCILDPEPSVKAVRPV